MTLPGCRRLLVSGTAGIDRSGKTVYVGDVKLQTEFTMEVVGAILESRGMDFSNVTRGIGYFKYAKDCVFWMSIAKSMGWASYHLW